MGIRNKGLAESQKPGRCNKLFHVDYKRHVEVILALTTQVSRTDEHLTATGISW